MRPDVVDDAEETLLRRERGGLRLFRGLGDRDVF